MSLTKHLGFQLYCKEGDQCYPVGSMVDNPKLCASIRAGLKWGKRKKQQQFVIIRITQTETEVDENGDEIK